MPPTCMSTCLDDFKLWTWLRPRAHVQEAILHQPAHPSCQLVGIRPHGMIPSGLDLGKFLPGLQTCSVVEPVHEFELVLVNLDGFWLPHLLRLCLFWGSSGLHCPVFIISWAGLRFSWRVWCLNHLLCNLEVLNRSPLCTCTVAVSPVHHLDLLVPWSPWSRWEGPGSSMENRLGILASPCSRLL